MVPGAGSSHLNPRRAVPLAPRYASLHYPAVFVPSDDRPQCDTWEDPFGTSRRQGRRAVRILEGGPPFAPTPRSPVGGLVHDMGMKSR